MKNMNRLVTLVASAGLLMMASACGKHKAPNVIYMPEMAYSPALKAQEEGGMRMPVAGTVPRNHQFYAYAADIEAAGRELKNPLQRTAETLKRGQVLYNSYCIVCHGVAGEGNGTIVPKYPMPPSLQSDKIKTYPDGKIYHVITVGQNLMPSYASQIDSIDRWAVIHYIRALQRSKNPLSGDLEAASR